MANSRQKGFLGEMVLLIAGIVRTFQQQQAVSALVVTSTSMLGGLFWPIEIVSPLMQSVARINASVLGDGGL